MATTMHFCAPTVPFSTNNTLSVTGGTIWIVQLRPTFIHSTSLSTKIKTRVKFASPSSALTTRNCPSAPSYQILLFPLQKISKKKRRAMLSWIQKTFSNFHSKLQHEKNISIIYGERHLDFMRMNFSFVIGPGLLLIR
jgi:hypothetical protein